MAAEKRCPECGAVVPPYAPGGMCLKCMLRSGLEESTVEGPPPEAVENGTPVADGRAFHLTEEGPGRYTGAREHARGGMGRILIARDEQLGRDVVVKELLPESVNGSKDAELPSPFQRSSPAVVRFLREARVTGQLQHPSIVPVYELGRREDGTFYYTMKQVQGMSLSDAIRQAKGIEDRLELLPHFLDLCQAVSYAHSRGVIHRDIKPRNVMVGEFGETVLLDWGLAKVREEEDLHGRFMERSVQALEPGKSTDAVVSAFGQILGTPVYMAPEQARGDSDQVDERSDVYGLGAVLYTLLTTAPPFEGNRSDEILAQVIDEEPRPVLEVEGGVPRELAAICHKAMAKSPEDRYGSAKELAHEVQRFLSGGLVVAYEYGFWERLRRFVSRNRKAVVTAGVALLLLVVLACSSYIRILKEADIAVKARQVAETERAAAEVQRGNAEAAQARAVEEAERAQLEQYYRTISLAASWLEGERKGEVADLLMSAPERLRNWEWGYLLSRCQREEHRVQAHEHSTGQFALSPDGKWLVSHTDMNVNVPQRGRGPGVGCQIVLWDAETMKEKWRRDVDYWPAGVAIHPENTLIAIGGWGNPLYIYDMETGEERVRLGPDDGRFSLCFSPDGEMLVEAPKNTNTLVVRRTQDWEVTSRFEEVTEIGDLARLAFSPNSRLFASGNRNGRIVVRDTDSWRPICEFQADRRPISSLVFDSTSTRLISTDFGLQISIWNIDEKTEEFAFPLVPDRSFGDISAVIAPDDSRLFVSDSRGVIRCVRLSDGEVLGALETRGHVSSFACSFELERVYVGNGRGEISCWRFDSILNDSLETTPLADVTGGGRRVCYSLDGKFVLWCNTDWQIEIRNAETFERVGALTPGSPASVVCFRPGTDEIFVPSSNRARFYRIPEMEVTDEIPVRGPVHSATFDASGQFLLLATQQDEGHTLWDIERRQTMVKDYVPPFGTWQGAVSAISRDGKRAVIGARGMSDVGVLQLPEGELLNRASDFYGSVRSLAVHPDSRIYAAGDYAGYIYIRTTESPDLRGFLTGHRAVVWCLAFSPDGNRLLSGAADGTFRLWDWRTGQELLSFPGSDNDAYVPDVAFSPDGLSIVLTGVDPPLRILRALPWREPDPNVTDSDRDGLTDAEETRNGTDPLMADSAPPSVQVNAHTEPGKLFGGEQLALIADVSDDGRIMYTDLLVNGELADSDYFAPYEFEWTVPVGARIYELAVATTDTNENVGTSETLRLEVFPDPLTTAVGRVVFADGRPAPGARVTTAFGMAVPTGPQGDFSIPEVKTTYGDIVLRGGFERYWGKSVPAQPVREGVTQVGDIVLVDPVPPLEQTLTVGPSPCAIFAWDLNRDGYRDIVTGHVESVYLSVLLGNGRGTFEAELQTDPVGKIFSMVAAEMNGDNIPDLVTANVATDDVAVLLGIGNGTFDEPTFHDVGDYPRSVVVADFNDDDYPDIVTANLGSNDVSVLIGTADGEFQDQQRYPVGKTPDSVVALDVDHDGIPDLVVANRESDDLSVLVGRGDATFEPGPSLKAGAGTTYILVEDLNGDGTPDLAVANRKSEDVSILIGKSAGGFEEAKTYALGQSPKTLTIADLDRDGISDIVTCNPTSNSLSFLLGNGDGTFDVLEPWESGEPFYSALYEPEYSDQPLLLTTHQGQNSISLLSPGPVGTTSSDTADARILGTRCENPEVLAWSTFLGGEGTDSATAVAVDRLGNFYVAGVTNSSDFPVTSGAYDETYNGSPDPEGDYAGDAYLAKFDGGTGALVFATFLGGRGNEEIDDLLVLDSGEIVMAGPTGSDDFPTTPGVYDESHNGDDDIFVAKLNATGEALVYSTFLGGAKGEWMWAENRMAVDALGNVYLTGGTNSPNFPTTPGVYQPEKAGEGGSDAFVAKLSADGTTLIYSTFLGGSAEDLGLAVDVGPLGEAYVVGRTKSANFPVTKGAYQEAHGGGLDAFVTKLTADGGGLVYSTFLGGPAGDMAYDVLLDAGNEVFVAGQTSDSDFPTTAGAYDGTYDGNKDMFLLKLNATGTALVASTLLGGSGDDFTATSMSRDALGNIWVSGFTDSPDVPLTSGALHGTVRTSHVAELDAPVTRMALNEAFPPRERPYVAQFDASLTGLSYATFLDGGTSWQTEGFSVADGFGNVFVAGATMNADFPVTREAFDTTFDGDGTTTGDVFVLKLNPSAALTTASSAEDDLADATP